MKWRNEGSLIRSDLSRAEQSMLVLRIIIAGLILIHGLSRWWFDAVEPFGQWLTAQGFPLGLWLAYFVTGFEIMATPVLAFGRFIVPLCLSYVFIYGLGILLVHAPEGWFVVGLGRNGMEYSVLLIVCLLAIAYQNFPAKTEDP